VSEQSKSVTGIDGNLVRAIGTLGLAASIVNVTVGGGIFRLPGSPEVTGRLGAAAPLAYLACAIVMGLIVLCIAGAALVISSRLRVPGGVNPAHLGWMSAQWLAQYRASQRM